MSKGKFLQIFSLKAIFFTILNCILQKLGRGCEKWKFSKAYDGVFPRRNLRFFTFSLLEKLSRRHMWVESS